MSQLPVDQMIQLAIRHHQAGRLVDAEAMYRQVLAQRPGNSDALHLLGLVARQNGRHEVALDLISRAIAILPKAMAYHFSLGAVWHDLNRLDQAAAAFSRAIQLKPDWAEAHYGLANVLREKGKTNEAIAAYNAALRYKPDFAEAHNNLGDTLRLLGNLDEAIAACRRAIELKPAFAMPWSNLGIALWNQGNINQAVVAFSTAAQLDPNFAAAWCNLGNVLLDQKNPDEAIAAYSRAIRLAPNFVEAHHNLASMLREYGMLDAALASYDRAMALKPDDALIHGNRVCTLQYHPDFDVRSIYEAHCRWNQLYAQPLRNLIQPHRNIPDPARRLKVGYVSPDLWMHPVGRYLLPLLQRHDRAAIEVFCYSDVRKPDQKTELMRAHTDHWRNILKLSDDDVAALIRKDQIDILVDLAGHTAQNRLLVFARKPAPVQVAWLGYPNTTGMTTMDYRLTDQYADPVGMTELLHTERIERLPDSFLCYLTADEDLPVAAPPILMRGHVTFTTFNTAAKINRTIVALWAQILARVPAAKLLIKCAGMSCSMSRENLLGCFAAHGIIPDRLEMRTHAPSHLEHMKMYDEVDIALDTFPYHGTTTTCEALWMGVPVVTLAGQAHVNRVGVSILSNIGLPKLIAQSPDEYVGIAVDLAADVSRLTELRTTLRERMQQSPLLDAPRFTRNIEASYRKMWLRWIADGGDRGHASSP